MAVSSVRFKCDSCSHMGHKHFMIEVIINATTIQFISLDSCETGIKCNTIYKIFTEIAIAGSNIIK